jgi:predicted nucleic acid-binding protein
MTAFLLDTCTLSEGIHGPADAGVEEWAMRTADTDRYTSVICLAEVQYGIWRLPRGKKRDLLLSWYQSKLRPSFDERIVAFGEQEATMWAALRAEYPNAHNNDAQIAATALVNGMVLVTRNVKDFAFEGLSVFNPWRN